MNRSIDSRLDELRENALAILGRGLHLDECPVPYKVISSALMDRIVDRIVEKHWLWLIAESYHGGW